MYKKTIHCKRCQQKMGTGVFDSILNQGEISNGSELPQEIEMPDLDDELLDRVEAEKTEKLGIILKYPCPHCDEDNFLNLGERTTILFYFYLRLLSQRSLEKI